MSYEFKVGDRVRWGNFGDAIVTASDDTHLILKLPNGSKWFSTKAHCVPIPPAPPELKENDPILAAWGIIANAGGGNWDNESAEWRACAERWRERYVDAKPASATPIPPKPRRWTQMVDVDGELYDIPFVNRGGGTSLDRERIAAEVVLTWTKEWLSANAGAGGWCSLESFIQDRLAAIAAKVAESAQ